MQDVKDDGLTVDEWIALPDEIGDFESPEPGEEYFRARYPVVDGRTVSMRLDAVFLRWVKVRLWRR